MSQYIGENFNGVLFLLREPNSNEKPVDKTDNKWISQVLTFQQIKSANRYRKTFLSLLKSIQLENEALPHCAFDNIKPDGGASTASKKYWEICLKCKIKRTLSIFDEIKPSYVFTCLDIYAAIKSYLISNHINFTESDGITYIRRKRLINKHKLTFIYDGRKIQVFQIYHPCLAWNMQF